MKWAFALVLVIASVTAAEAQYRTRSFGGGLGYGTGSNLSDHAVSGYTTRSGTYIAPHYSTNPNGTQLDNFGTRGNYNPHNGLYGTRSPKW